MTFIKKVKGKVISGVGKGKFYVLKKPYFSLFKSLLNAKPYPGTLNVVISDGQLTIEELPHRFKPSEYGEIRYTLGEFSGIKIVVLRPCKSVHPKNVFEIVAPVRLRDALNIMDGENIEFEIIVSKRKIESSTS